MCLLDQGAQVVALIVAQVDMLARDRNAAKAGEQTLAARQPKWHLQGVVVRGMCAVEDARVAPDVAQHRSVEGSLVRDEALHHLRVASAYPVDANENVVEG